MIKIREIMTALALLALPLLSISATAQTTPVSGDVIFGKADAPVTIIEYASFTCPHCAAFHAETFPLIKRNFIETGKVKLIFRDFPLDQYALRASMLARCSGADRYYSFVEVLFAQQLNWVRAPDPVRALAQIAKLGGVGEAEFTACLANPQIEEAVLKSRLQGVQEFNIESTPSFIINGKLQSGALPYSDFETVINTALSKTSDGSSVTETSDVKIAKSDMSDSWPWLVVGGAGVLAVAAGILWWRKQSSAI